MKYCKSNINIDIDLSFKFLSDNCSPACDAVLQSILDANTGISAPYGDDYWSKESFKFFDEVFETKCDVFFVLNGVSANSLSLATVAQPFEAVLCNEYSHIYNDECSAPQFFSNGLTLIPVPGENGKLTPDAIFEYTTRRNDKHFPKIKAISITQPNELGLVYTVNELQEIYEVSRKLGLKIHMDGSRFANAVAFLNIKPKYLSWANGVDVMTFGGVKNGGFIGDAIVFFNKNISTDFLYRQKQSGQLIPKSRYIAAAWIGLLKNDIWLSNAKKANRSTKTLEILLKENKVFPIFPCETNSLFLEKGLFNVSNNFFWRYYQWLKFGTMRFVCSWDTEDDEVKQLSIDIITKIGQKI